jgi:hypothetical protein
MSVAILIVLATVTGVLATRQEEGAPPQSRIAWARLIAYWLFTVTVAFELAAGALWAMLRIGYVRVVLAHLGSAVSADYLCGVQDSGCSGVAGPTFPKA